MNERQLLYFCETVDAGSAVAAAQRLNVAPTAISMQILQLEQGLGGQLFDRSRRPMATTALGKFLYPRAKDLLRSSARLAGETRAIAEGRAGVLAIGYTRSSLFSILPRAARRFSESHPDVRLELMTMLSEHQPDQLLSGRIEVGIARYLEPPAVIPSLRHIPLFRDDFCLAVPLQHRLADKAAVPVADLRDVPLITYPKDARSDFAARTLRLIEAVGVQPMVTQDAPEIHTALGLVAAGLGCCLVGKSVQIGSRRDIAFVPVTDFPQGTSTVYAVTNATAASRPLDELLAALMGAGREIEQIHAEN